MTSVLNSRLSQLLVVTLVTMSLFGKYGIVEAQPSDHPCMDPWAVLGDLRTTCLFEIATAYNFEYNSFPLLASNACLCDNVRYALEDFRCCEDTFLNDYDMLAQWLALIPEKSTMVQLCSIQCDCFPGLHQIVAPDVKIGELKIEDNFCENKDLFSDSCCTNLRESLSDNLAIQWGILNVCDATCPSDQAEAETLLVEVTSDGEIKTTDSQKIDEDISKATVVNTEKKTEKKPIVGFTESEESTTGMSGSAIAGISFGGFIIMLLGCCGCFSFTIVKRQKKREAEYRKFVRQESLREGEISKMVVAPDIQSPASQEPPVSQEVVCHETTQDQMDFDHVVHSLNDPSVLGCYPRSSLDPTRTPSLERSLSESTKGDHGDVV